MKGSIDSFQRGMIRGWINSNLKPVDVYLNGKFASTINKFHARQDVIDAGLSIADCGFTHDLTNALKGLTGLILIELKVKNKTLVKMEHEIQKAENLILDPFLTSPTLGTSINSSSRVGYNIERFIAPEALNHSNGTYSRLSILDKYSSHTFVSVDISVDETAHMIEQESYELMIVARASRNSTIIAEFYNSESDSVLLQEGMSVNGEWSFPKALIPNHVIQGLIEKTISLRLKFKHVGLQHFDLSMICLSTDNSQLSKVSNNQATEASISSDNKASIIDNNNLTDWNNGLLFGTFSRSTELADNWFIELAKSNVDKVSASVFTSDKRTSSNQTKTSSSLGLRIKTQQLSGYARISIPFLASKINVTDYTFSLSVENLNADSALTIPRISLSARDSVNDTIIHDVIRKQSVTGLQEFEFTLSLATIKKLHSNMQGRPLIAIFVDLPSESDLCFYGVDFKEAPKELQSNTKTGLDVSLLSCHSDFEDQSITQQLSALKGLDNWRSDGFVTPASNTKDIKETQNIVGLSDSIFSDAVYKLRPAKMKRNSRQTPLVTIVIPVYNACDDVLLCLSSIIEKTDVMYQLVIINDGDDKRTAEMLDAFDSLYPHVSLITNETNQGYTKSVNIGLKNSFSDWVVILNSDTIVTENWLSKLLNCALSDSKAGMIGAMSNAASWQSLPKIHDESGDWNLNPIPAGLSIDEVAQIVESQSTRDYPEVKVINGFCQLINMKMIDEIGPLDEVAFPIGYGEENDMCARAVKAGYKLFLADDTYIYHSKSKSFGHDKRKELAKSGAEALKRKHPDVNWSDITKEIYNNPTLVQLRSNVESAINKFKGTM